MQHANFKKYIATYLTTKNILMGLFLIIAFLLMRRFSRIILPLFFLILTFIVQKLTSRISFLAYFGVEAGYFSTVMIGYLFGSKAGMMFGFAFFVIHIWHISQWSLNPFDVLVKIIMIPGIGYLGAFFSGGSIILPGTIIIVVVSFMIFLVDQITVRSPIPEMAIWCVSLVIFNNMLFSTVGPILKVLVA